MLGLELSASALLIGFFGFAFMTEPLPIYDRMKRKLAEKIAIEQGLYDVYFDLCSTETLLMIKTLRQYEGAYCESLIDLVTETLSISEMLLILGVSRLRQVLKPASDHTSLIEQAQTIAHFYIDVAKHRLWHELPHSGPHAQRICSRWRRRSN